MNYQERQELLESVKKLVGEKAHAFAFVAVVDRSEDGPANASPTNSISIWHDPMFGGQLVRGAVETFAQRIVNTIHLNDEDTEAEDEED